MSRDQFYEVKRLAVSTLLLDTFNPRIRHGQDQQDCIARILRDRENFLSLLKDIANNGLSIEHIVISKNSDGKWVVRDGNRRITALKLLNRPNLALPDKGLVSLISRIRDARSEPIMSRVTCMACDDEATIATYLKNKHTGVNAGVGQKPWSAFLISLFNLQAGITDQNRRAAQLLLWAEEHGLQIDDDYPITTLTRGLSNDTLEIIGFSVERDNIFPTVSVQSAYAMVERVIRDIGDGVVHVKRDTEQGSIFTKKNQINYFRSVRDAHSIDTSNPHTKLDSPPAQTTNTTNTTNTKTTDIEARPPLDSTIHEDPDGQQDDLPPAKGLTRQRSAARSSWDRPCLFGRRKGASPGLLIPDNEKKAISVVSELRKLNPMDSPIATAMLFRYLIELSDRRYRRIHSIKDSDALHKNIANAAEHMNVAGLLDRDQLEVILRHTRSEQSMLHIKTLQAYVHNPNFHPNGQAMNTFWDEIGCFVLACWQGYET